MAEIEMPLDAVDEKSMPAVCIRCGAPAPSCQERSIRWFPWWNFLLLPFYLLISGGHATSHYRDVTICMPVCDRHRSEKKKNAWLFFFAFLALAVVLLQLKGIIGFAAMLYSFVGLLILHLVVHFWSPFDVRVKKVNSQSIVLVGVSKEFVAAYPRPKPSYY